MVRFISYLVAACLAVAAAAESEVVTLTSDNFEHETQVATGATTGDWFVKFYAPWCGHCKKMAPAWESLAVELKEGGLVNIAEVDVTGNRALGTRFEVKGFPTLLYFTKGTMYKYQGPRELEALTKYANGGYKDTAGSPVPGEPSIVDEFKKAFTQIFSSITYYLKNPGKVKENEWGFLAAGLVIGTVFCSFIFMTFTMMGPAPPPPTKPKSS
eukprot:CAMPEP_0182532650 /NCGR_PEP_ID=MMETSP1323-20130603/12060_1 /TAXON_ID=236787 /ORGANISM="Florenciella parvula, Strain RCC1693" /LENGTH=212 /DNA_ID=CAMNT_0024742431 /DNA_START=17 /DNA_END=655 /DNA_ORIENTATION=-